MMIWMIWEVFGEGISHNYALHLKNSYGIPGPWLGMRITIFTCN